MEKWGSDDLCPAGFIHRFQAVVHGHLFEDAFQVSFHRVGGKEQVGGDGVIGKAAGQQ